MPFPHFPGPSLAQPWLLLQGHDIQENPPERQEGKWLAPAAICTPAHGVSAQASGVSRNIGHRGEGRVDTLLPRSQKAHIRRLFGTHVSPGARRGPRKSQGSGGMLVSLRPTFIKKQYGSVPFLMETREADRWTPVSQEQAVPDSESGTPGSWEESTICWKGQRLRV